MRRLAFLPLALLLGCSSSAAEDDAPTFPEKDREAEAERLLSGPDWYRHAVFYELFVRSYQDSNADGIGDFAGLTTRLDYLEKLGIDALWLMPIMPTPFFDSGYDVADYQDINSEYGSLDDFDAFVEAAHSRGIRVLIDLVLNHTSDQHPWFVESRSSRDNPKADWYVWSDTPGTPNNGCGTQQPIFGDSAWKHDATRDQYYFHRFYPQQPDLNYENPEVVNATLDAARFWLERGVDGFRCDVIALLFESANECDLLPETRDYIRQLRALLDEYPDRAMVAESTNMSGSADYFGDGQDMFHMAFNFRYGYFWGFHFAGTTAAPIAEAFEYTQAEYPAGAQDALVIGSHDVPRAYTAAQGDESRQRRAALVQLTMPGSPYLYYGEELSLRPGRDVVVDGRDSARTPMPWTAEPGHGFSQAEPWLAFGADVELTNVEAQRADAGSMYHYYEQLLAVRRGREVWGTGTLELFETDTPAVLVYRRSNDDEAYVVAVNISDESQTATADGLAVERSKRVFGEGSLHAGSGSARVELPGSAGGIFRIR